MAIRYVYTGGSNTSPYDTWAKAATSLTNALTGSAAGDVFYIAHDHTNNMTATTTLTSPGTAALPCQFLCVNRAGSVPPVSADLRTTAIVQTTGAFSLSLAGVWYIHGVSFITGIGSAGAGALTFGTATGHGFFLKNCKLRIASTATNQRIVLGTLGAKHVWDNVTVEFGGASQQGIVPGGLWHWRNTATAVVGATFPTLFFPGSVNVTGMNALIESVDLSALGSSVTLFSGGSSASGSFVLKDCKLGASVIVYTGSSTATGNPTVDLINCDSGDTNTRNERYRYGGSEITERTIVRTGGASDGTTAISRRISASDSKWIFPFECTPIAVWNETVGSAITLTMEGIWTTGSLPNNDQVWFDVEYLGDASFPLGTWLSGTKADILATAAAQTTSSSTWGGSTTKFKQSHTITPQGKGWIYVHPRIATSTTVYIDPEITVT